MLPYRNSELIHVVHCTQKKQVKARGPKQACHNAINKTNGDIICSTVQYMTVLFNEFQAPLNKICTYSVRLHSMELAMMVDMLGMLAMLACQLAYLAWAFS